ncbi:hypothetical protein HYFRA_00008376 [Hymenoscyphus fraxineus]|uniref:Uncharacterized protein n=1 Tax=Hymenoscyphus fraxineus TaxID=746836 RepID=A0A9N9KN60_9HELO|nr:hypothetical protein HYFRA_00008376 [Hymenoscyphus fraxineus]
MSSASMNTASAPAPHPTANQKPKPEWEIYVDGVHNKVDKFLRATECRKKLPSVYEDIDMEERIRLHVRISELEESIFPGPGSNSTDNTTFKPKWLTWIEAAGTDLKEKQVRLQLHERYGETRFFKWEDFFAAPDFQISKYIWPNIKDKSKYDARLYCLLENFHDQKESSAAKSMLQGKDGGNTKREGSVAEAESSKSKRKWQTGVGAAGTDVREKETRLQLSEDSGNLDLTIRVEEFSDPNRHVSKKRKTMFSSEDPTKRPTGLERHSTWLENKGETSKATSGGHDSGYTNQDDRVPVEEDKGRKDEGKDGGNREQDERFVEDEGKELKGF